MWVRNDKKVGRIVDKTTRYPLGYVRSKEGMQIIPNSCESVSSKIVRKRGDGVVEDGIDSGQGRGFVRGKNGFEKRLQSIDCVELLVQLVGDATIENMIAEGSYDVFANC